MKKSYLMWALIIVLFFAVTASAAKVPNNNTQESVYSYTSDEIEETIRYLNSPKEIIDWIMTNINYDASASGEAHITSRISNTGEAHTINRIWSSKTANCAGQFKLAEYMLKLKGYKVIMNKKKGTLQYKKIIIWHTMMCGNKSKKYSYMDEINATAQKNGNAEKNWLFVQIYMIPDQSGYGNVRYDENKNIGTLSDIWYHPSKGWDCTERAKLLNHMNKVLKINSRIVYGTCDGAAHDWVEWCYANESECKRNPKLWVTEEGKLHKVNIDASCYSHIIDCTSGNCIREIYSPSCILLTTTIGCATLQREGLGYTR